MFALIFWISFGALVGWIVGLVQGVSDGRHLGKYLLLGVLGGLVGGWGSNVLVGLSGNNYSSDLTSMMFAIVGAVIIIISLASAYSRRSQ